MKKINEQHELEVGGGALHDEYEIYVACAEALHLNYIKSFDEWLDS